MWKMCFSRKRMYTNFEERIKTIINQKIELLKFIHLSYSEYIYNKISELQKEINENN